MCGLVGMGIVRYKRRRWFRKDALNRPAIPAETGLQLCSARCK